MTFTLYEDIGLAPEIARHAWDIPEGEDVEIHINSCGGSVFGGMSIVAAINTLRWHGRKQSGRALPPLWPVSLLVLATRCRCTRAPCS